MPDPFGLPASDVPAHALPTHAPVLPTLTCGRCGHTEPFTLAPTEITAWAEAHAATCLGHYERHGFALPVWAYAALLAIGLLLGIVVAATVYPHG
jgi:hypothetical protein